jgi:hypothetical protein
MARKRRSNRLRFAFEPGALAHRRQRHSVGRRQHAVAGGGEAKTDRAMIEVGRRRGVGRRRTRVGGCRDRRGRPDRESQMADQVVEMAGRMRSPETGLQQKAENREPGAEAPEITGHGHALTLRGDGPLTQAAFRMSLRVYLWGKRRAASGQLATARCQGCATAL